MAMPCDCRLVVGDCVDALAGIERCSIDLTVASPPYDNLRRYGGKNDWNMGKFVRVASELYRVTKDGGVVVWIAGDQTKDGTESGTSFEQALRLGRSFVGIDINAEYIDLSRRRIEHEGMDVEISISDERC